VRPGAPGAPPAGPPEWVPPPSPRGAWWHSDGGAALIGIIGLIAGAAIGIAVAGGGGRSKTVTERQQTTQTVIKPVTVTRVRPVVHTHTVTVTTQTAPPSSAGGGETQSYSGSGGKTIGTITVARESTLEWTNSGELFVLHSNKRVLVNSEAHSGTAVLEPATYTQVRVNAVGHWTITVAPK
jgi:hypothetical protein